MQFYTAPSLLLLLGFFLLVFLFCEFVTTFVSKDVVEMTVDDFGVCPVGQRVAMMPYLVLPPGMSSREQSPFQSVLT